MTTVFFPASCAYHALLKIAVDLIPPVLKPLVLADVYLKKTQLRNWPRGKESTKKRKTQNKGKESENSYRKLKSSRWTGTRPHTRKQNQNISTDTAVLLNQKRTNVYEHTTRMASLEFRNCYTNNALKYDMHRIILTLSLVSQY